MTYMMMFRQPDLFAAGAALRPVGDWADYNDGYTSAILNRPDVDPQAYYDSSPINYAGALKHPLLIMQGMEDDNVFFIDTVHMTQKLIELRNPNFDVMFYPDGAPRLPRSGQLARRVPPHLAAIRHLREPAVTPLREADKMNPAKSGVSFYARAKDLTDRPTTASKPSSRRVGPRLVVGTPLGIGKPNHLLNALYPARRPRPRSPSQDL